jgi:hypothetical protein
MLNPARLFLIALIVFSFAVLAAIPLFVESPPLLFGSRVSVLPTWFFPAFAASAVLVLSIIELLRVKFAGNPGEDQSSLPLLARGGAVATLLIVFAVFALDPLGYIATLMLISSVLAIAMGNRQPIAIAVVCVGIPVLIYWLLAGLLATYLPTFG